MTVLEQPAALAHGLDDAALCQYGADGLIAPAQPLGHGQQVRHHTFLLAGVQRAGATHATHDLVQDEQDAMPVAQVADTLEIAGHRREHACRRATDGLCHKRHHVVRPQFLDGPGQFGHQPLTVGLGRLIGETASVLVAGRHMGHVDQQRTELLAAPFIATHRQCAQGIAVVALASGDEVATLGLADLDEVLPGHLQGRLDRLGATTDEVHVAHAGGCGADQQVGQLLGHLGGEEAGVGIGQLIDLAVHGRDDVGMTMAQTGHRSTTAGVDVGTAFGITQPDALPADGHRRTFGKLAMKDVGGLRHGLNL